jgi:hypothetical protein
MIGKITGGASFGGALDYLMKPKEPKQEHEKEQYKERLKDAQRTPREPAPAFEAGERHRVIGGNMNGDTKGELAEEFRAVSRQRPDIKKPVHHASLSAGENDKITVEQWNEIAEKYVEKRGFGDSPYVVIQHRDGKTDHIHILTSRVDIRGKVISDWQCKERAEKVLRGIEKDYGLEQVKSSHEVERAAPKRGEIEHLRRIGELSAKMVLQGHVQAALQDKPSATQFIELLQLVGVETIPYVKDGRATGVSFRKGKQLMKGSDLGRGFSWSALQERGLDYHQERDRPAIEAARLRADQTRAQIRDAPSINPPTPERAFTDLTKDVRATQTIAESLQRAAGLEPNDKDAVARLHHAAGLEPSKDDHDAIDRLNKSVGLEREDQHTNPAPALEQIPERAPSATPPLEREVAERTIEPVIEFSR